MIVDKINRVLLSGGIGFIRTLSGVGLNLIINWNDQLNNISTTMINDFYQVRSIQIGIINSVVKLNGIQLVLS